MATRKGYMKPGTISVVSKTSRDVTRHEVRQIHGPTMAETLSQHWDSEEARAEAHRLAYSGGHDLYINGEKLKPEPPLFNDRRLSGK